MNRGIDLTPVTRPLRLPVGSDIRLQVAVADKTGVPVDLTGTTLTVELLKKATRHVELALTADTSLAATGTIDFTATSAAIADVTETALTWRLRDTTTNVDWITGPATITTTGQTAPGTATIPVTIGSTTMTVIVAPFGVGPIGDPGPQGAPGPRGPSGIVVLDPTDPIPAGTPAGTLIVRLQ